jgi:glycosyltransferase involved in cell wall biosynthesis
MAHVVMLVHSDYYHDNRVVRQAELLAAERYKITVLAAEPGLSETVRKGLQNGVEVITCRLNSDSGKSRFTGMMRSFERELRTLRADLVHAHDLDTLLPAWKYTRSKGIPLIYDSHELYLESTGLAGRRLNRAIWAMLERFLIGKASAVITVCDSIAAWLESHYRLPQTPEVIRNFSAAPGTEKRVITEIPLQVSDLRERLHKVAVYQGLLREGRGLDLMIDVFSEKADWGLIICGSGPWSDKLEQMIKERSLEDRVVMTGQLPHHTLAAVTSVADAGFCFIEPVSLSYTFALPNKLSEYVQARIPVIGSDLPEISKLIHEHDIGYVCSGREDIINALADIEKPGRSEWLRNRLDIAAPLLSWESEGEKLLSLYEKLI